MPPGEPATAADAEALSAFAEASFVDTFGHIYDPADLAAFLAGWNPPERIAAQIADPDWTVALVRGAGGAILGFVKLGPIDFALPPGQPSDDATELRSDEHTSEIQALMRISYAVLCLKKKT